MISRDDLIVLLTDIESTNNEATSYIDRLFETSKIDMNVLKFINDNRQLDVTRFYEKIRKSYNAKKSKLYINIMKEINEPLECLTTLSAMLTQIYLFSKNVEDKPLFLKHSRADEISKVLYNYSTKGDIIPLIKLIKLIKADIKVLESVNR